jgi:hypothetical protein
MSVGNVGCRGLRDQLGRGQVPNPLPAPLGSVCEGASRRFGGLDLRFDRLEAQAIELFPGSAPGPPRRPGARRVLVKHRCGDHWPMPIRPAPRRGRGASR